MVDEAADAEAPGDRVEGGHPSRRWCRLRPALFGTSGTAASTPLSALET
jgi:hypothetical protein